MSEILKRLTLSLSIWSVEFAIISKVFSSLWAAPLILTLCSLEYVQVVSGKEIVLPPIFKLFQNDFGDTLDDVIRSWIIPNIDGSVFHFFSFVTETFPEFIRAN